MDTKDRIENLRREYYANEIEIKSLDVAQQAFKVNVA